MVFKRFQNTSPALNNTLIYLGAPEAEAEALNSSKIPLKEIYKDYCGLARQLESEKFILIGRKGSGKSAFAEYIKGIAETDPNIFVSSIKQNDSNLERLVQIGGVEGHTFERENLYKWIIYTKILKLFTQNQAALQSKEYSLLEQFLKKNSGYIDIRESEIKELVSKQGWEISTEYLKRFMSGRFTKANEIKQQKAPFYKLLPHLQEVILNVFKSDTEIENNNDYIIFFDDLDISFDANNDSTVEGLMSLLRVTKEINNEIFDKNKINAKVVILLRDDIAKNISSVKPDSAKMFSSYAVYINWYQDLYQSKENELLINLRKLINDRIKYSFEYNNLTANIEDPWKSFVQEPFYSIEIRNNPAESKTSFKYILDHTFFRPRDLILFFKPLSLNPYELPLNRESVNNLIGQYCQEVVLEIRNELSNFYDKIEIETIFIALGEIYTEIKKDDNNSISYAKAVEIIQDSCGTNVNPHILLEDLFERSLIGNISSNTFVYFKHREPNNDSYKLNKSYNIILHSAIRAFSFNKGYS